MGQAGQGGSHWQLRVLFNLQLVNLTSEMEIHMIMHTLGGISMNRLVCSLMISSKISNIIIGMISSTVRTKDTSIFE